MGRTMGYDADIAALEDKASKDIKAETSWQQCAVLAEQLAAQIANI